MDKGNFAFVTLATDDTYSSGALVLAHSLRSVNTKHQLVALVTAGVSTIARERLNKVFDLVEDVSTLDSKDEVALSLMDRPELGVTFTKIQSWRLVQFTKCVFLDADILVLKNCDELFERAELSAVPDVGWPDCFNSGMFVFQPSVETYNNLMKLAVEQGSFDGGDQGLLNMYFSDWATKDISTHLSFIYNMNVSSSYTYLPAYREFGKNVKIVHFLGSQKPWMYNYDQHSDTVDAPLVNNPLYDYLKCWWKIYTQYVNESSDKHIISEGISELSLSPKSPESSTTFPDVIKPSDESDRLHLWEQGRIDYMGIDSFDNIAKKLDQVINGEKK